MSWAGRTVEELREEFVRRALSGKESKSALCREYDISRVTGDKWIERYKSGESMKDRSRAPHRQPGRIPEAVEELIVEERLKYPATGAVKLKRMLENKGIPGIPSARTINNVFKRNGLITEEASRASTPYKRFEKSEPNELWQCDFKGHFALKDGTRCHPFVMIDDYSRYNLRCEALYSETFGELQPVMLKAFREYGLPKMLLCDNGNPWGSSFGGTGYSQMEVWLMELGIRTIHCRPHHPQTQGKCESFNRAFDRECLALNSLEDMPGAQRVFDEYRRFYNKERPHHALELAVPSSRYRPSTLALPERVEPWEYGGGYELRKVTRKGAIRYRGSDYFMSMGFAGKTVAIRESREPGQITVVFRKFKVARIKLDTGEFTLRRPWPERDTGHDDKSES